MKRIILISMLSLFIAVIALISCTKEGKPSSETEKSLESSKILQSTSTINEAVQLDNTVNVITGIIDDYEAVNQTLFISPNLKAGTPKDTVVYTPTSVESCTKVTVVKTPVLTGTVITGATIKFTIDFGIIDCLGKDGILRRGIITSTYTWVKAGGWSRESVFDFYADGVHNVGNQISTFSVIGADKHPFFTVNTTLTLTSNGVWKKCTSLNQSELIEVNVGVNPFKIYKIKGNSTFINSYDQSYSESISETNPLIKRTDCKTYSAGTVVLINADGVSSTVDYGTGIDCKDGYTLKTSNNNDNGIDSTYIKYGK